MKKITLLLFGVCLSLSLFSQIPSGNNNPIDFRTYFYRNQIGKQFPVSTITTIDNQKIDFHALNGKIVFINFWFKDCHGCMSEMKGLEKLYKKYKSKDILFLSISFDSPEVIREIQKKFGLSYKMASVDRKTLAGFLHGYPTSFIIDSTGKSSTPDQEPTEMRTMPLRKS